MRLRMQPLSPEAFAPYGHLVGGETALRAAFAQARAINGGTSLRVECEGLDLLAEGGRPALAVFRAQAQRGAGPWHTLERHALGSQTFLPLAGAPSLVLVALGECAPEPHTLAAFLADGRCGYTLHAGTWHHGLIALEAGDFAVLERGAAQPDCELSELAQPVWIEMATVHPGLPG